jgi:predicted GTPase
MGTFIHPSVYLLVDCYPEIYVNRKSWGFTRDLMMFRNKVIVDESAIFWEHGKDEIPVQLDAVRILVCGNNGVGKSTLINNVFGEEIVR